MTEERELGDIVIIDPENLVQIVDNPKLSAEIVGASRATHDSSLLEVEKKSPWDRGRGEPRRAPHGRAADGADGV